MRNKKDPQDKSIKVMVSFNPVTLAAIDKFAETGFDFSMSRSRFLEIAAMNYLEKATEFRKETEAANGTH